MPDWRGTYECDDYYGFTSSDRTWEFSLGSGRCYHGVVYTFLAASGLAIAVMVITRLFAFRLSIDFTMKLSLEPAPFTIFSNNAIQPHESQEGPLSITTEFQVDADRREQFFDLAGKARLIYLRNGAHGLHLK